VIAGRGRDRGLLRWGLAGALGLAAAAALHFWVPPTDPRYIVCLFRRVTGLPCPGCGMTRAFAHLAKGEWRAAVHDHPLAPLLAAEVGMAWLVWGGIAAGLVRWPRRLVRTDRVVLANAAVLVAVWLVRLATGTLPW
jgi:hypothetical protein